MATPTPSDGSSQLAPAFLPPPAEIPPAVPRSPKREKLSPWQLAALIIGIPVIAFFAAIGAYTSTKFVFGDPQAQVRPRRPTNRTAPDRQLPPMTSPAIKRRSAAPRSRPSRRRSAC